MKLTEKQISKAIEMGAKRWTKGDHDRLYLKASCLNGGHDKSGRVYLLTDDGDQDWCSRRVGGEVESMYIDVVTGKLCNKCDYLLAGNRAEAFLATVLAVKDDQATTLEAPKTAEKILAIDPDREIANPPAQLVEAAKLVGKNTISLIDMCWRALKTPKGQEMGWVAICDDCLAKARLFAARA